MKKYIFILILFSLFIFPNCAFAEELIPNGVSGILIEANSGKIIFEKEKDKRVSIASMTKMVAQIIILEEIEAKRISFDDIVTVSRNASGMGGSQIYIEEGEKISVRDLMKGISVASGNDATIAMAEYISGSEEKFVKRMNDVVKRLKLKNTHFVNCTGLDEDDHYSSSYDMAMIARELVVNHPKILEFSSIYEDYLREGTDNKFWLVNTNKLINFYDGADGLKTGHTDDAGYCLAATAKRGDLRLIGIVLGEKDSRVRNSEVMSMLDYGFNNVKVNCLLKKDTVVQKEKLDKTDIENIDIILSDNLCVIEDKDDKNNYKYDISIKKYKFPIKRGDVVGNIDVLLNGKKITSGNLTVKNDINKYGIFKFIIRNLKRLLYGVF